MKTKTFLLGLALCALAHGTLAAPADYDNASGYVLSLPYDSQSYGTSASSFGPATPHAVDGYALAGRVLAATGRSVFLQQSFGVDGWTLVARVDDGERPMDPSFLDITKSGAKIALGTGFYQPLYIFDTARLSASMPPNLTYAEGIARYDLNYYDGAWRDERYLFLNAAGHDETSEVWVVDSELAGVDAARRVIAGIAGASAGIVFDRHGNLITGIGYDYDGGIRTGELRIFPADLVALAVEDEEPLSYEGDGLLLAANVLSAASLQVDAENNLYVGGGDVFGTTENLGFAAAIDHTVLARVLDGGAALDPSAEGELTVIAPDPCMNDDSVRVLYIEATDMLTVSMNIASPADACAPVDWTIGDPPVTHAYFSPNAPDDDGDGVPNGVDPDHAPRDVIDRRDLDRLVQSFGAEAGDPTYAADLDEDADLKIDWDDFVALRARWGQLRP